MNITELSFKNRIENLNNSIIKNKNIGLSILRIDFIDNEISGNKWYKLKYNIKYAKKNKLTSLITFGGAFSNHILATAKLGYLEKINTIGYIRGEKSALTNVTLKKASEYGMKIQFINRKEYKLKNTLGFLNNLRINFPNSHIIPEGANNELGLKGCQEILKPIKDTYDIICCPIGTGNTFCGLINSSDSLIIGFPAYKANEILKKNILRFCNKTNYQIINTYYFGGFAKYTPELIDFIHSFHKEFNIPLDFIYTGKMLFGIMNMIKKSNLFNNKKVLIIHTGGIQGNLGLWNQKKIKLPVYDGFN